MANQNLKTFLDDLDGFLKRFVKQGADDGRVDANTEDEVHNDTELDIPRDENLEEYETGSYEEEQSDTLDEFYHGHAGDAPENTDKSLDDDAYRRTEDSPEVHESGEGDVPTKRKPKELQDTESPAKVSSAKLAEYIDYLSDKIINVLSEKKAAVVGGEISQEELAEAESLVKQAYADANLALEYLDTFERLVKAAEEVAEEAAEKEEEKPETEETPEEEVVGVEKKKKAPEDVDVSGDAEDLQQLLESMYTDTGEGAEGAGELDLSIADTGEGEEETPHAEETPPAEEEAPSPETKPEEEVKQASVIAALFSQALDDLGVSTYELRNARGINKQAAAELANAVEQFRRTNPRKIKVGRSAKLARLYCQFTDYIKEITNRR
jgi:hypothetical protein